MGWWPSCSILYVGIAKWNLILIGPVISEKSMFKYVDGNPIWTTLAFGTILSSFSN